MKNGFIKVAAGSPRIAVADVEANAAQIRALIQRADAAAANLLVLPELCLTGYTCGDLFYSELLLEAARDALCSIADFTRGKAPLVVLGVPLMANGKLYNCAAVLHDGQILGVVPKSYLPNGSEFYEKRQFTSAACPTRPDLLHLNGEGVAFDARLIFQCEELPEFALGVELCEDLWSPDPPSRRLAQHGATVIANPSASDEVVGKREYRRMLVQSTSARLLAGYVYVNADSGESTQDMVFSRHNLICESGTILAENPPFGEDDLILTELDVQRLTTDRHRSSSFAPLEKSAEEFRKIFFHRVSARDRAHPRLSAHALRTRVEFSDCRARGGNSAHSELRPEEARGAHPCENHRRGRFRRTGQLSCAAGDGAHDGSARARPPGDRRRLHALLRNHPPHPLQR